IKATGVEVREQAIGTGIRCRLKLNPVGSDADRGIRLMLMDGFIGERMGAMHGDHHFSEFGRAIAKTWRDFTEDVPECGEDVGFVEGDPCVALTGKFANDSSGEGGKTFGGTASEEASAFFKPLWMCEVVECDHRLHAAKANAFEKRPVSRYSQVIPFAF